MERIKIPLVFHILMIFIGHSSASVNDIEAKIELLGRQMMTQEQEMSDCKTGFKSIRMTRSGTKPYNAEYQSNFKFLAIHNHADHRKTVGLGEFTACLNGVEFRTRHNDFPLLKPKTNDARYHATEDVAPAEVPPQVLKQKSVDGQISEMRKCFKAWKEQNPKDCDYRKYFKAVLCYLEGSWTLPKGDGVEEGFKSDRHFIDARNWFELHEKARYSGFMGYKDNSENFAFLPTSIFNDFTNLEKPSLAQWNYRILCHELKDPLPLKRLHVVDDLMVRNDMGYTPEKYLKSNAARFVFNPALNENDPFKDDNSRYGFLDTLMEQIPGKNNYGAYIKDNACNVEAKHFLRDESLNAANYHRWFRRDAKHAGHVKSQACHRGFNDRNVFMAKTTQARVAGARVKCDCDSGSCKYDEIERWTYAVPLEVIYISPLTSWNPYDIIFKGLSVSDEGRTVTAKGRNGDKKNPKRAYNGTHSKTFYTTPPKFFTGKEVNIDKADTVKDSVGVLNRNGKLVVCSATGIRAFFPEIPGLGILRQRYPMMPNNKDNYGMFKELNAVRDAYLNPERFSFLFERGTKGNTGTLKPQQPQKPAKKTNVTPRPTKATTKKPTKATTKKPTKATTKKPVKTTTKKPTKATTKKPTKPPIKPSGKGLMLKVGISTSKPWVKHTHDVVLTEEQLTKIHSGGKIDITTSENEGHTHRLRVYYHGFRKQYRFTRCDNRRHCPDRPPTILINCAKDRSNAACKM